MIAVCADALALRRVALVLLAPTRALDDHAITLLQRVGADAWRVFLIEEGYAALLLRSLKERAVVERMPPDARRELEQRATSEMQRFLSAKAQLMKLARIARDHALRVVVLKGGVAVAEDTAVVYTSDLDVLTAPKDATQLAEHLRAVGYSGGRHSAGHHLEPLVSGSEVPIEIHTRWDRDSAAVTDDWWSRTRTLAQYAPLECPSDAEQLWHFLVHMVEHHSELRGRLRDSLLASAVAKSIGGEDLAVVEDRIKRHVMHAELQESLEFARALESGVERDPYVRRAAGRYLLRAVHERFELPGMIRGQVIALTLSLLDGRAAVAQYTRRVLPTVWRKETGQRGGANLGYVARVIRRGALQIVAAILAPVLAALARKAVLRHYSSP